MYLPRFPATSRNSEADPPTHSLPSRDAEFERPPEYSPADSEGLGVPGTSGTSQGASPNYSKRPSGNITAPTANFLFM